MVVMPQEELATGHAGEKAEVTFTHTAIADGKVGNSLCSFAVTHAEVDLSGGLLQNRCLGTVLDPLGRENAMKIVLSSLSEKTGNVGTFGQL